MSGTDLRAEGEGNGVTAARRHIDLFATETSHIASGLRHVPELKTVIRGSYCRISRYGEKTLPAEIRALADQDPFSNDNFGGHQ